MTDGLAIRQAFVAAALEVEGVGHALTTDPVALPKIGAGAACVSLFIRRAPATIVSTGPIAEVKWEWTVYVYVQLRDYVKAQNELELLLPRLMLITLIDNTLGETCDEAYLIDDGDEPFAEEDGNAATLVKRLRLVATGEISP